jgi:hypothetical protein
VQNFAQMQKYSPTLEQMSSVATPQKWEKKTWPQLQDDQELQAHQYAKNVSQLYNQDWLISRWLIDDTNKTLNVHACIFHLSAYA